MAESAVAPESTATQDAERWLRAFETALADRDAAAAAALFATDSYWRDLVAFTWNLKTVEGREGVADLLEHTVGPTGAHGFTSPRPPRGRRRHRGLDRLRDRGRPRQRASAPQGGQGLDVAHDARRAQGPRGAPRDGSAARRRARRRARSRDAGSSAAGARPRSSGSRRSPTSSSSAAGRAASGWARACASSASRPSSSTATRGPATSGAAATSRSASTIRSGTTTFPTSSSPRTGPCSRRRTRSATGSRCTRA